MESTVTSTVGTLIDKGKLFLKGLIIFFMALGLWIPTLFIRETIREREGRQREAVTDITSKWGTEQTIQTPVLALPFLDYVKNEKGETRVEKKTSYFMPDKTDLSARIYPERRTRGIYEVIVYRSEIEMSGQFNNIPWQQLKIPAEQVLWNEARLSFNLSDHIRGLNEDVQLNWNDSSLRFQPVPVAIPEDDVPAIHTPRSGGGLSTAVTLSPETASSQHRFSTKFGLNGSEKMMVAALGVENKISMASDWPNPSFTGMRLPDARAVNANGFDAQWKFVNRAYPQVWNDNYYYNPEYTVGTELFVPLDNYDKTDRSVKYALLCFILTFAAFFLIEITKRKNLHLIQYALAGFALVLFYTLLLSISEYLGFNWAYLIAGAATIFLVAWYLGSIMKSTPLALFISLVLAIVYGYIFTIIQMQDYALLMGSVGLFIALGVIMYFSKRLT